MNTTVGSKVGFSYVANPYVCPVDWVQVYAASSGINGTYWYLDPTTASTGSYRAYNALSGSSVIYADAPNAGQYVQAGQAFFVQAATSNPNVIFNESAKMPSSSKLSVFGATNSLSKIYITLLKQTNSASITTDGVAVAFGSKFSNVFGTQDGLKFGNGIDNVSILDKGKSLSIDGRLPATVTDVISLNIEQPSTSNYKLKIDASAYLSNGVTPYLLDSYKNTQTAISGIDSVAFIIDTLKIATYTNRFSILFKPSVLPISSITASATLKNGIATISWKTAGEENVINFIVEKSADAKTFTKIAQATAKNIASAFYTATDNSVLATTYYRIKAISTTGSTGYSNVAKLSITDYELGITTYPNPAKSSVIIKGSHIVSVEVVDNLGRVLKTKTFKDASNPTLSLSGLQAGAYHFKVQTTDGKVSRADLVISN